MCCRRELDTLRRLHILGLYILVPLLLLKMLLEPLLVQEMLFKVLLEPLLLQEMLLKGVTVRISLNAHPGA